jgi:hypothetical protein
MPPTPLLKKKKNLSPLVSDDADFWISHVYSASSLLLFLFLGFFGFFFF